MKKIDVKSLQDNVFSLIGDRWMLITAGTAERCNTMTASWGGLGVLWGAPAATIYLRPQRYTKEFVDREELFHPGLLRGGAAQGPGPVRQQERPGGGQGEGVRLHRGPGRVRGPLL